MTEKLDLEVIEADYATWLSTLDDDTYDADNCASYLPALIAEVRKLNIELASTMLALGQAHRATAKAEDERDLLRERRDERLDEIEDQANKRADAIRQSAINAFGEIRKALLTALGREDDQRTQLVTYVADLARERDELREQAAVADSLRAELRWFRARLDEADDRIEAANNLHANAEHLLAEAREQRDKVLARTRVVDTEDVTDWQRGYRACSEHVQAIFGVSGSAQEQTEDPA